MLRSELKLLSWVALLTLGCTNAGSDLGPTTSASKSIGVNVYLDRDGSNSASPGDTVYHGARISLRPLSGGKILQTVSSSPNGDAEFRDVPVGQYLVTVDSASLGDTLGVGRVDPGELLVRFDDDPPLITIRLTYPEVPIRAARQAPLGRRLLLRGLILAGVQSFRDTTSHVADTSSQLRLTRVVLRGGITGNNPGDSVTVLGTVSSRAGQPTLDQAIITMLGPRPAPIPVSLTTATAATASGGVLDAGLVQITNAVISDTLTVAPDFHVVGSDGSGPVTVVLDPIGGFFPGVFLPGRRMSVRGVLVPTGSGVWRLKPRTPGDVTVF
jgi:hypothetical protein